MKKKVLNKTISSFKAISSSKAHLSLFLLVLILPAVLGLFMLNEKKNASDPYYPKSAAIHLYHDEFDMNVKSGTATSDYVIPKNVVNSDFTLRLSLKSGENNLGSNKNIFSIEGNGTDICQSGEVSVPGWRKRVSFYHDNSSNSHINFHSNFCDVDANLKGGTRDFGERTNTRAISNYEDYFLVYKKPIPGAGGSNGYYRIYRAFDQNESIIPQGMDNIKSQKYISLNNNPSNYKVDCTDPLNPNNCVYYEKYLSYEIDKETNTNWQGNDSLFRIVVGDPDDVLQDIKIAELTMWTQALDSDMGVIGREPVYSGDSYGVSGNYDKYQSAVINSLTHSFLPATMRNNLYFHFWSDEGLSSDIWKNDAVAAIGIDLKLNGASSLTSDVPNWPTSNYLNSNYPESSTSTPVPAEYGKVSTITNVSNDRVDISNIPVIIARGSTAGLPVKTIIYISTEVTDYKYTSVKKALVPENSTSISLTGLGLSIDERDYMVITESVDKLENVTWVASPIGNQTVKDLSTSSSSLRFTGQHDNRVAIMDQAYELPINQPSTFRILFKLNQAPTNGKEIDLFGLSDNSNEANQYYTITANNSNGKLYAGLRLFDGDKYYRPDLNTPQNDIKIGEWQEFWLSYKPPTSTTSGLLYVYSYDRTVHNLALVKLVFQPIAWSWFSDWAFKKGQARIFYGSDNNYYSNTDFLINQTTWWSRNFNEEEIKVMAGNDINKVSSQYKSYLLWHSNPDVGGVAINPNTGTLIDVHNMALKCMLKSYNNGFPDLSSSQETDCNTVSDTPFFLNADPNTPFIFLNESISEYENTPVTIAPVVANADKYNWSLVNLSDSNFVNLPEVLTNKSMTITFNATTGKDRSYKLKFTATNSTSGIVSDNNCIDIHIHKLADIDGDNIINFTDFSTLLSSWGTPVNPMANIIREGLSIDKVDFQDFSALLSKWGS